MRFKHTLPFGRAFRRAVIAALSLAASTLAYAGETPSTVVELFTSQGCSSCPTANEFVGQLSENEDLLVLTYGVTYWDYLGWKDTFGDMAFTDRQRAYGQAFGIGNVYTPQIILNGSDHSPRYSQKDVISASLGDAGAKLSLKAKNGKLVLDNSAANAVIVSFKPGWQNVDVSSGENQGRTLRLANVVSQVTPVTQGEALDLEISEGYAYAALVHDAETLKVIGASVYRP